MKVRILVRLKPGIMDVQGTAIQRALGGLGFSDVSDLRVGKVIELELPGERLDAIRGRVDEICRKLLVNPVLEDYTVEEVRDLAAPKARG